MIRGLILALFLLLPGPLAAETIPAKSGEHADFTRIVLQFGNLEDWKFGRVEGGYELRTGLMDAVFDLTGIFDKIPKSRISQVSSPAPGRLFFSVSCQCTADVFEIRQGRLVIDVKSGGPTESSQFETRLDNVPDRADTSPITTVISTADTAVVDFTEWAGFGETFPVEATDAVVVNAAISDVEQSVTGSVIPANDAVGAVRNEPVNPEPILRPIDHHPVPTPGTEIDVFETRDQINVDEQSPQLNALVEDQNPANTTNGSGQTNSATTTANAIFLPTWPAENSEIFADLDNTSRQRTSDLEEALLKHLSRAASQGLVTISPTAIRRENPRVHANIPATSDPDSQDPEDQPTLAQDGHLENMQMQTAVDRDRPDRRTSVLTVEGGVCLDENILDVSAWGNSDNSGNAFGSLRTGIVGEFDRPNPQVILALIRRYIFLGFGIEAKSLITSFAVDVENSDILNQIAEVIDFGQVRSPGRLVSQVSCDTNAAMWAILSIEQIPPGTKVKSSTVLRTFSGLPAHLRHHIGSDLAQRFIDNNDIATATSILSLMDRAPTETQPGSQLIAAELAARAGETQTQFTHLERAIQMPGPKSAVALAEFIETKLDQNQPLSEQTALLAGAMAVETRDLEIGRRLTKAAIRAFAVTGQIEPTFQRIRTALENGYISTAEAQALAVETHLRNAQISSNANFLTAFFRHRELLIGRSEVARSGRLETAQRLVDLHFPEDARALYVLGEIETDTQDRIVIATANLATGSLADVHLDLSGHLGTKSQQIIASTLEQQKDFLGAAQIYSELGQLEDRGRAAWLAGDWATVVEGSNVIRSAAANMVAASAELSDASPIKTTRTSADPASQPPMTIAGGTALMERSAVARDIIRDLLNQQ